MKKPWEPASGDTTSLFSRIGKLASTFAAPRIRVHETASHLIVIADIPDMQTDAVNVVVKSATSLPSAGRW